MAVLTENDVRRMLKKEHLTEMIIAKGTIITPSARSFLSDRGINLVIEGLEKEQDTPEIIESKQEEQETVTNPKINSLETYGSMKLCIQWKLLKVEVIKCQKSFSETGEDELGDKLHVMVKTIDDVIESLKEGTWLNTTYLNELVDEFDIEPSIEMTNGQLEMYRLLLLTESVCYETSLSYSNVFGVNMREDFTELETKLPMYLKSLIIN
ncbi:hypothetical protein [Vagococcus sp.]|uniref:hypothetical protein n=1 Tax=Vagococcus sp. TaxID=1933889 RepID=UPI002FC65083